ncbi:phage head-tail connector protein [Lyticum sinuosum]|uniref:Phage gp6-like head-tail connector protein n=1 Tax=Lyticum sinuosum TaxID=1332059 RepID=A0AAE4VLE6_9RICK|nr:phage head-tail connector protein [Lyticum sinuosum]MDZ5760901.1 putative phage gp6-like head-tail connector protein [Lyticum sinuosum]
MTYIEKIRPVDPPYNPIDLQFIKNFLRIDHNYDDKILDNLACAAVEYLENEISQAIIIRDWNITCRNINDNYIRIPIGPVQTIKYIKCRNYNYIFSQNDIEKSKKYFTLEGNVIYFHCLPNSSYLSIIYTAGDICKNNITNDDNTIPNTVYNNIDIDYFINDRNLFSSQIQHILLNMIANMYDGKSCDDILKSDSVFKMRNYFL